MKWEKKKVSDVCELAYGKSLTADSRIQGEYPVYGSAGEVGTHNNFIVEGPGIIIGRKGSVGTVYYEKRNFYPIDTSYYVVLKPENDLRFLYYKLQTLGLNKLNSDAAVPGLNRNVAYEQSSDFPPLPTQRNIAAILSAYDDLIENNLKRIKLLEEKAFLRYKQILETEELTAGIVGDLAIVKSGFAFKSKDWSENGFSVIKIRNIGNNDIDLVNCSFIPENIAETATKAKLNAGDLLIAMTGATVGKIGMMPKTETAFYLNQRVGQFIPKTSNAEYFLFCFFNEPNAKNAVESLASGAAQPNISGSQIESIKMFYPKFEIIKEFGKEVKNHFELIWNLKQQNTRLRAARDILLPRLMSGQIEV